MKESIKKILALSLVTTMFVGCLSSCGMNNLSSSTSSMNEEDIVETILGSIDEADS